MASVAATLNRADLERTDKVQPLLEWVPDLTDMTVLEPGSYNGRNTWQLMEAGANVICIEPRIENVAAWSATIAAVQRESPGSATILQGTVETLRLPDCDLIFHSGLLYHLRKPAAHLKRLASLAPRLFLNTHYTNLADDQNEGYAGYWRSEDTANDRAGLLPTSFWLDRPSLFQALTDAGYSQIATVTEKVESNGMRIGLLCEVSS